MQNTHSSMAMVEAIQKIIHRHSLIFFSKLILYQPASSEHNDTVRHYDLQCEGAQMIYSLLSTKLRGIEYKFMDKLKNQEEEEMSRKQQKISLQNLFKRKKGRSLMSQFSSKCKPRTDESFTILKSQEQCSQVSQNSKFKAQSRIIYSYRQSLSNLLQEKKTENLSKLMKRKKILEMLDRLQCEISQLSVEIEENREIEECGKQNLGDTAVTERTCYKQLHRRTQSRSYHRS